MPERGGGGGAWWKAGAPAALVLLAEGLAWIAVAITDSEVPVASTATVFAIAVLAAILMPLAIVVTRRRDALLWGIVSICTSAHGLFLGALLRPGRPHRTHFGPGVRITAAPAVHTTSGRRRLSWAPHGGPGRL